MMKKIAFNLALAGLCGIAASCGGGGEGGSSDEPKVPVADTVQFTGNSESCVYGGFTYVTTINHYIDNFTDDGEIMPKDGKKIIAVELHIDNNSDNRGDLMLAPASFTLDLASTPDNESIGTDGMTTMKTRDYTRFDGDVGCCFARGYLYYVVDASVKAEDLVLNALDPNTEEVQATIAFKDAKADDNSQKNVASEVNKTAEFDAMFGKMLNLTVTKMTDHYEHEGSDEELRFGKLIRLDVVIENKTGDGILLSDSHLRLASKAFKNDIAPEGSIDYEGHYQQTKIEANSSLEAFLIYNVPFGDSEFELILDDDEESMVKIEL